MTSRTPCPTRHGSCSVRHQGACRQCSYPRNWRHQTNSSPQSKPWSSLTYLDLLLSGFEDHVSRPNHVASHGYFSRRDGPLQTFQILPPASTESLQRSEKIAEDSLRYLIASSQPPSTGQPTYPCLPNDQILREIRQGTWIVHYRFAEAYSDILVGLLDEYLQIWELDGYKLDVSSLAANFQPFKFVRSPLHFCAAFGCERLGQVYLQMGYNPNLIAHPGGQSPLHLAAAAGHLGMVKLFLGRGANIETRTVTTGRTALLLAAFRGQGAAVTLLLEAGAAIDAQDDQGLTASELASTSGYDQTATFVLGLKLGRMSLTAGTPVLLPHVRCCTPPPRTKSPAALQSTECKLRTRPEGRSYRRSGSCSVSCSSCLSPSSVQCQAGPESTTSNHSSCLNCGHKECANCDQENTDEWVEVGSDSCDQSS
jgi:hypothetical protein